MTIEEGDKEEIEAFIHKVGTKIRAQKQLTRSSKAFTGAGGEIYSELEMDKNMAFSIVSTCTIERIPGAIEILPDQASVLRMD